MSHDDLHPNQRNPQQHDLEHHDRERRDLEHLHPDRIRIGSVGVFAGDWAWTPDTDGAMRIAVGFVGTLIDTFFRTTKIVGKLNERMRGVIIRPRQLALRHRGADMPSVRQTGSP